MKKSLSVLLILVMLFGLTTSGVMRLDIETTGEPPVALDNLWLQEEHQKSAARKNYEQLLTEDITASELKGRFEELFGTNITAEELLENCEEIFDTPKEQIDQGLLQLLTRDKNTDSLKSRIDGIESTFDIPEEKSFDTNPMFEEETLELPADEKKVLHPPEHTPPEPLPENEIPEEKILDERPDALDPLPLKVNKTSGDNIQLANMQLASANSVSLQLVSITSTTITIDVAVNVNENSRTDITYQSDEFQYYLRGGDNTPPAITERLTMTDLEPATKYEILIWSFDYDSMSSVYDRLTIVTNGPNGQTISTSIQHVSSTDTTITFDVDYIPTNDPYNQVKYYDPDVGDWVYFRGEYEGKIPAVPGRLTLTGLKPGTQYRIMACTFNYHTRSWVDSDIVASTTGTNQGPPSAHIEFVSATSMSITVDVTFARENDPNNQVVYYDWDRNEWVYVRGRSEGKPPAKTERITISGLRENAQYFIQAKAFDGFWVTSEIGPQTKPYDNTSPVTRLDLVGATNNTITVDVFFSDDNNAGNKVQYYDFGRDEWVVIRGTSEGKPAAATERITIEGLELGSQYYIQTKSYDPVTQGWVMGEINATTAVSDDVALEASIDVVSKTDTSITVYANFSHPGERNNVVKYRKRYTNTWIVLRGLSEGRPAGISEEITIINMLPNTEYEFYISAKNTINGQLVYHSIYEFTKLSEINATTVTVDMKSVAQTTATVDVSFSNNSSAYNQVMYAKPGGDWVYVRGQNKGLAAGTTGTITIYDLDPNTFYTIAVESYDQPSGEWAHETVNIKTEPISNSGTTSSVNIVSASTTSVTFDVAFSNNNNRTNVVRYCDTYGNWTYVRGVEFNKPAAKSERITLSNLTANRTYNIQAASLDSPSGVLSYADKKIVTNNSGGNSNEKLELVSATATSITVRPTFPTPGKLNNFVIAQTYGAHAADTSYINISGGYYAKNQNYTVSGLTPNGYYDIVMTYYDANNQRHDICRTFRTTSSPQNLQTITGTKTALKVESQQVSLFNSGMLQRIVAKSDSAYTGLQQLLGTTPHNGKTLTTKADRSLHGTKIEAVAQDPILWASDMIPRAALRANYRNNDVVETILHEMGHEFDSSRWSFEVEAMTIFYTYYLVQSNNWTMVSGGYDNKTYYGGNLKTYFKSDAARVDGTVSYDVSVARGQYSPYGMAYNLAKIADQVGWEPFIKTFRYFKELRASEVPATSIGKFNLFVTVLKSYSGYDIIKMLTTNEINVYSRKLGGTIAYVDFDITGTLKYTVYPHGPDGPTKIVPLSNYKVNIYEKNAVADRLVGSAVTNANGTFSFTTSAYVGGNGYYLLVDTINNDYIKMSNDRIEDMRWRSNVLNTNGLSNLTFGMINISTTGGPKPDYTKGTMNIYHFIKMANDFYYSEVGDRLPAIKVSWYPDVAVIMGSSAVAFYSITKEIFISDDTAKHAFSPAVIIHEYGHYIHHLKGNFPLWPYEVHYADKPLKYDHTGYSEGYATFFQAAVRMKNGYSSDYTTFMNGWKYGFSVEKPVQGEIRPQATHQDNCRMEPFVAGAMYDLFDGTAETHDNVQFSFSTINRWALTARPDSIQSFYNHFFNNTASGNEYNVWKAFEINNVGNDTDPPNISSLSRVGSTREFSVTVSDNIRVEKIEWYYGNTYFGTTYPQVKSGTFKKTLPGHVVGQQTISAIVYDETGLGNNMPTIRTNAFSSKFIDIRM